MNDSRDFSEIDQRTGEILFAEPVQNAILPAGTNITIDNGIVTAQKVAVPRNLNKVMADLKILAAFGGDNYYYSWPTKNKDNSKGEVSGPTIKMANDLMRTYGNSQVGCDIRETPTHYIFAARMVDLESGSSMMRLYQQRKSQQTGLKDKDRQEDIVFQIGQSKAIRNVVANFLQTLTDFVMEEARKNLIERFGKDLEGSKTRAVQALEDRSIPLIDVERSFGKVAKEWTARDLARLSSSLQAIKDGMATIEDIFPSGDTPKEPGTATNKAPAPPAAKAAEAAKAPEPAQETEKPKELAKKAEPAKPAAKEAEAKPAAKKKEPEPVKAKTPEPEEAQEEETGETLIDDSAIDDDAPTEVMKEVDILCAEIMASVEKAKAEGDPDLILKGKKDPRYAKMSVTDQELVVKTFTEAFEEFMK